MWRNNIILTVVLFNLFIIINGQDDRCFSPNNTLGLCVILPKCLSLQSLYERYQRDYQVNDFIESARRNCRYRQYGVDPIVCCQDPIITIQYPVQSSIQLQTVKPPRKQIQYSAVIEPPTYNTYLRPTGKKCKDPNGLNGNCMNIKECASVLNDFVARFDDQRYIEFIKRSNRYCDSIRPFICCPDADELLNRRPISMANGSDTPKNLRGRFLTPEEGCGNSSVARSRLGGSRRAPNGAWPWLALLGYENKRGEKSWECGGSLITTRHVLSSAYCVIPTLSLVRLGEHDISLTNDGDVQDINIVRSVKHPNYDKRDGTSDIAVLYLEYDAQLSFKVFPICMPIDEPIRSQSFTNYNPFTAGWGHLEGGKSSNVALESQLTVQDTEKCRDRYLDRGKLFSDKQFSNQVLCAGNILGGQGDCESDLGGPLMQPIAYKSQFAFYQIGVVSYEIACKRTDVPAVFASVQYFIDWITERVHE